MSDLDVIMVRVYIDESERSAEALLQRLRAWEHIRGATVFEGARGFGKNASNRTSLVIEFFETPEKADEVLDFLAKVRPPLHIVSWPARLRLPESDE